MKEVEEGKFTPSGRNDVLARAIGRPEHPGRLRGVPLQVGVTKYYGKTAQIKKKRKTKSENADMVTFILLFSFKFNSHVIVGIKIADTLHSWQAASVNGIRTTKAECWR